MHRGVKSEVVEATCAGGTKDLTHCRGKWTTRFLIPSLARPGGANLPANLAAENPR
jgi:hypothetical protein